MKVKSIYINLPVRNIPATREFWSGLGFSFNEQFSNEQALCLVLNDGTIYSMLISHELFSTFTNRAIADGASTQVLLAIEAGSREQVDEMVSKALASGGARYRSSEDHGWMYYDSFADPDGHQWEVLFTDESKLPRQ